MSDPWEVLGLAPDCTDEMVRLRYLELVRRFPPEQHADRFAEIRQAYESLRDLGTRLSYLLFEAGKKGTVAAIIEDLECHKTRCRMPLEMLLSMLPPS